MSTLIDACVNYPNGIMSRLIQKAEGRVPDYSEFLHNSGHNASCAVMLPPPRHPDATPRDYEVFDLHGRLVGLVSSTNPHEVWANDGRIVVFDWYADSTVTGESFVFPTRGCAEHWLHMLDSIEIERRRKAV